ncbi:MAG: metalloregulator ArsR/SmtB family transcription factor [Candidatus Gracilibacteria bacterium]|nr:metalloregulator ArsR/SmtB family transcription factor [Candidatus Gracilibacteria bacterium]
MSVKIDKVESIADLLKNFSNSNKLKILCFIGKVEKNVSEIIENVGISQSLVSQILNKMKLEKILESQKSGKEIFYKISDEKILKLIKSLKNIFN